MMEERCRARLDLKKPAYMNFLGRDMRPCYAYAMSAKRKMIQKRATAGVTLGRPAAAKLNAVEGISISKETREMFSRFDKLGLSAEERRRLLKKKFGARSA